MKKSIILLAVLVVFAIASAASAATIPAAGTSLGTTPFTPSAGVVVQVVSAATSYCATAGHPSGKQAYATCGGVGLGAIDASKIVKQDCDGAACVGFEPSSATSYGTGWN